jgi:dTDP-4-amino-4,6-dideoxygalactose transaminase
MAPEMAAERWIRHSASGVSAGDFAYIEGVAARNFVGPGPLCEEFRQLLRMQFSCGEAILTDSGTAALHLALRGLAQQYPGRTGVLVSAYVCPQVVSAVIQAGLEPVLVDTCTDSLNMNMRSAARQVGPKTLTIICSHIGGMPDDCATAAALGVPFISDCAQGVGSRLEGRDVACEGVCAILSFGSTKMATAGGGGALLCRSDTLAATVTALASPELPIAEYRRAGFRVTYGQHMGDLTAGLASAQLRRLNAMVERRRTIADSYESALSGRSDVKRVSEADGVRCNRFRYYFLSPQASLWIQSLHAQGIDARGSISHSIPQYGGSLAAYPGLAGISSTVVSLPIFPAMSDDEVSVVANALRLGPVTA